MLETNNVPLVMMASSHPKKTRGKLHLDNTFHLDMELYVAMLGIMRMYLPQTILAMTKSEMSPNGTGDSPRRLRSL